MKEALLNSKLLKCSHADMQLELIKFLSSHKKVVGFERKDFSQIALQILDFISSRCKDNQIIDSYKIFILNKVKLAFDVSLRVKTIVLEKDEIENMLDIPDDEFPETVTDYEYLAKLGWKHDN